MAKLTIDFSTRALWQACPQRFAYQSVRNFVSGSTDALNFGSLLHFGTELLGKANLTTLPALEACDHEIEYLVSGENPDPDGTDDILLKILRHMTCEATEQKYPLRHLAQDERRSLKHALALLARYAHHYHPETLRLMDFETKHTARLGQTKSGVDVFYRGTIDGLLDDAVLERKTTGYIDNYSRSVNPNDQATGYLWLARQLTGNQDINRVVYDVISTMGYGKSRSAASSRPAQWNLYANPAKLFLRTETTRTKDQILRWRDGVLSDAEQIVKDIRATRDGETVVQHAPKACHDYNTSCPFIALCQSGEQLCKQLEASFEVVAPEARWEGYEFSEEG